MHGNKGKRRSEEVKKKMSLAHKGKNLGQLSPNWKGDKVSYSGLHHWIKKELGSPNYCEICKTTDENKVYDWANKDHKYRRAKEEFMRLCRSCHRGYDYKNHLSDIGNGSGSIKNKIIS